VLCILLRPNQPGRPTGPAHSPRSAQPDATWPQPHPAREPAGPVSNPSPRAHRTGQVNHPPGRAAPHPYRTPPSPIGQSPPVSLVFFLPAPAAADLGGARPFRHRKNRVSSFSIPLYYPSPFSSGSPGSSGSRAPPPISRARAPLGDWGLVLGLDRLRSNPIPPFVTLDGDG